MKGEGTREINSSRSPIANSKRKKKNYWYRRDLSRLFFVLFFTFHLSPFTSLAETKPVPNIRTIDVSSDVFDMIIKDSMMTFSKNVRIKSGSFEAQCDKAQVYIEAKTGKVKKIIMNGKVKIQKENSQINGEKVTFEVESQRLTVEGSVKTKIKFSE